MYFNDYRIENNINYIRFNHFKFYAYNIFLKLKKCILFLKLQYFLFKQNLNLINVNL